MEIYNFDLNPTFLRSVDIYAIKKFTNPKILNPDLP